MPTISREAISHGDAQQRYEQLVASIDGIVWEADVRTHAVTFVSGPAERLLGYPVLQWLNPGFWVDHLHPDDRDRAVEGCQLAIREKRRHDVEYRMITADGRTVWLQDTVSPVVERAEVTGLRGIMVDITDRKQAEEALREREELYRLLAENCTDLIALLDLEGRMIYASPSVGQRMGWYPAQISGASGLDRVHPDDRAAIQRAWEGALAERTQTTTFRYQEVDGSWRWLEARMALERYRGQPHVKIVARDITEYRRAEQERLAHLRFLERLDQVNRAIQGTNDLEPMMRDVLDAVLESFGCDRAWLVYPCDPEATLWRVPMERTRPEYPGGAAVGVDMPMDPSGARVMGILRDSSGPVQFGPGGERPVPFEMAQYFGVQSFIAMAIYPKVGKPWSFGLHQCSYPRAWAPEEVRLFQEIGRRVADALTSMLAYRNLQDSEARFRMLVDQATDAFFLGDEQGTILDVNQQACASLGYTREELIGMTPPEYDVNASPAFLEPIRARLATGEVVAFDSRHRRKDGTVFPVEVHARWFWQGGRRFGLALARDITERKRAEQALVESYNLLNAVVEGASDSVFVKDLRGRYLMINSAGARFFDKRVEDVIGSDDRALLAPEIADTIMERDRQLMATGASQTFEENVTSDGVTRTYLSTESVYRDVQGNVIGIIGIRRDITDLKRLEEQFRQAQKMEAVGRLAGGVAHDFNNLLTIIIGNSELVFESLRADDPNLELVALIRQSSERAATLTRQLLAFSRKQILQPQVVNLNTLLGELLKLLQRILGDDIELALVPGGGLGRTKIDPGQFEQAIINLAVNARDAMPEGGRLIIETHNIDLNERYAEYHPEVKPGRYIQVVVSDSGEGMDEATKPRIFEPFFTTKEPGKGTGLGLAMVYGFVKQSGGHIEAYSELGHGTTFRVYLPRAEEGLSSTIAPVDLLDVRKGTETILVVEDEAALRNQIRIILQSYGYTILTARDGQDGLHIAQQYPEVIHLVVTDLVMPQMSGRQLADLLTQARPGVRILFMSGYTDEAMLRHGVLEVGVAFLQKPFTPMDLAHKVREVLDAKEKLH